MFQFGLAPDNNLKYTTMVSLPLRLGRTLGNGLLCKSTVFLRTQNKFFEASEVPIYALRFTECLSSIS